MVNRFKKKRFAPFDFAGRERVWGSTENVTSYKYEEQERTLYPTTCFINCIHKFTKCTSLSFEDQVDLFVLNVRATNIKIRDTIIVRTNVSQ